MRRSKRCGARWGAAGVRDGLWGPESDVSCKSTGRDTLTRIPGDVKHAIHHAPSRPRLILSGLLTSDPSPPQCPGWGAGGAEGQSNTPLAARSVWLCKGRAPAPGVRVSTCPGACLLRVHLDNIGQLPQAAVIHVLLLPLPVHKAAWRRGRGVGCGWQQRCKGDPAFQSSRV